MSAPSRSMTKTGLKAAGLVAVACAAVSVVAILIVGAFGLPAKPVAAAEFPDWAWVLVAVVFVSLFRDSDRKVTLSYEDREAIKNLAHQNGRIADAIYQIRNAMIDRERR